MPPLVIDASLDHRRTRWRTPPHLLPSPTPPEDPDANYSLLTYFLASAFLCLRDLAAYVCVIWLLMSLPGNQINYRLLYWLISYYYYLFLAFCNWLRC